MFRKPRRKATEQIRSNPSNATSEMLDSKAKQIYGEWFPKAAV